MKLLYINTLKELSENDIKYALLRKPINWVDTCDLDIIVKKGKDIDKKLKRLGYSNRNSTYIKYDFKYKKWIYLDLNNPLKFGKLLVEIDFINALIKNRYIDEDGIYRINKSYESILYLIHAAINKGFISEKYKYLIYENNIDKNFLIKNNYKLDLLLIYKYLLILKANPKKEKSILYKLEKKFTKPNLNFLIRKFNRFKNLLMGPRPIVFLGPDGSGKSTLVNILKDLKLPNLKLIYMGPNNELEMNKLLFKSLNFIKNKREKYNKKTLIGITVRTLWYLICYLDFSLRIWRNNFFVSAGGIIICDRYACDIFFRKPNIFTKFIFLDLFLRPRFVFLCVGNSEKIYYRKPELKKSQIKSLILNYRKILNQYSIEFIELDTTSKSIEILIPEIINNLNDKKWLR
tara:strand:- start:9891 stop:11102 length:1212 start_codon:yes stop_codon:yes gene_type:complete